MFPLFIHYLGQIFFDVFFQLSFIQPCNYFFVMIHDDINLLSKWNHTLLC